jgi:cation:H+ antiporter
MLVQVILLLISLIALYYGAEKALEAAEKVGKAFGLSPLVIGLLIVGFGTSLPELFVSQLACFRGHSEIAVGNIIGSNIANIFLVLAASAIFVPLRMAHKTMRIQFIWHLALTILLTAVTYFSTYSWISSIPLVLFFIAYLYYTFVTMKKHEEEDHSDHDEKLSLNSIFSLLVGFTLLYGGGELLVSSGSKLGMMLGVSEYVLSAVIVAFGTSFPELVTAMVACRRKKHVDLITGNIIGSNVFNVAFVMGSLGFYKFEFTSKFIPELSVLMFASIAFLALSFMKKAMSRTIGIIFFMIYLGMVGYWIYS